MNVRLRKLVGLIALVILMTVYGLTAMVYTSTHLEGASRLVQLATYLVAGLGWVIPAAALIRWMQKPDPEQ